MSSPHASGSRGISRTVLNRESDMVMQSTIDYLKRAIKRIESHPEKKEALREHLARLKETVRNAEASLEATEEFYRKLNTNN